MGDNIQNIQPDDRRLETLQKRMKAARIITIAGIVSLGISVVLFFIGNKLGIPGVVTVGLFVLGFVLAFFGVMFGHQTGEAQKIVANRYAVAVLEKVMDRVDVFDTHKSVGQYYMKHDFGFPKHDRIGYCGDYVRCVFDGIPVEFSEFELQEEHVRENSDGDTESSYETNFYGIMAVCQHGLTLTDAVVATQYGECKDPCDIGDTVFQNAFSVGSTSKQDALLALSKEYRQSLLELTAKKGRNFVIRFLPDGKLLAVLRDQNLFEVGKAATTQQLMEKMESELTEFTQMLRVLMLPAKQTSGE